MRKFRRKIRNRLVLTVVIAGALFGGRKLDLSSTKSDAVKFLSSKVGISSSLLKETKKKKPEKVPNKSSKKTKNKNHAKIKKTKPKGKKLHKISIKAIPKYKGVPYVKINGNIPSFSKKDKKRVEEYSKLDKYGRCGVAFAKVGIELMPTEKRGSIGQVKPTGWHTIKYPNIKDRYLYNRCHLIAYQLAGENANEKNLITGTRYLNVDGMLPFENEVAEYIKSTNNHVLYRVKPIFNGDDLVARGVQIEAQSLEDKGRGIKFNVFCYNVQPGIAINYKDGSSRLEE